MYRYGRINRATYWLGLGVIAGLYAAMYFIMSKPVHVAEFLVIALAVPRLHDIGKSGWWAGGAFIAEIVVVLLALATLPLNAVSTAAGIFVILIAGLMIYLGLLPGELETNRFGDQPPRGISYRQYKATPPADHFT